MATLVRRVEPMLNELGKNGMYYIAISQMQLHKVGKAIGLLERKYNIDIYTYKKSLASKSFHSGLLETNHLGSYQLIARLYHLNTCPLAWKIFKFK